MTGISISGQYGKKPAPSGGRKGTDTKTGFDAALTSAKGTAAQETGRPPQTGGKEGRHLAARNEPCILFPDSGKFRLETTGYFAPQDTSTEDEIREKIREKYNGGTLADQCRAACELSERGIDQAASRAIFREAYAEMLQATEADYGHLPHDDLTRILAMFEYAQGKSE